MRHFIPLLLCTSFLTACEQGPGYQQNQNTYKGAAAGAAVGAAAGALTGNQSWGRTGVGAGIGALAGAGIGQYMDRQEQAMRQATQGTGIEVQRQGNDLLLNMPSSITFATDSSTIRSGLKPTLNNIASVLAEYPDSMVEITGHTDSTGSDEHNMALSDRRAASVSHYLNSRGITQRIIATGMGEDQPIASNDTASDRAQNRRVEVKISPISR